MIRIKELKDNNNTLDRKQQYICPNCFRAIEWKVPGCMSPFNCMRCMTDIVDITNIIKRQDWRISYHFGGKNAVMCLNGST